MVHLITEEGFGDSSWNPLECPMFNLSVTEGHRGIRRKERNPHADDDAPRTGTVVNWNWVTDAGGLGPRERICCKSYGDKSWTVIRRQANVALIIPESITHCPLLHS